MLYHVDALLSGGAEVDLIAYAGDATPARLRDDPSLVLHAIASPGLAQRHQLPKFLFILYALIRQISVLLRLAWILCIRTRRPDIVLMQTPPAIPAMAVCLIAARMRSAQLAFDWHNYGYTILALRFGMSHPVVRLSRLWERWFGRRADLHFCVSNAMRMDLMENWGIADPVVFCDRPAENFRPVPSDQREIATQSLIAALPEFSDIFAGLTSDRSALCVSPTSWTADEDFSCLFDALEICDARIRQEELDAGERLYPDLVFLLTGRGPMRPFYEARASALPDGRLHVVFAWLPSDQYPVALGLADLGLCFHTSSSGLDLPMKIADMQGSGLPVCAYDYGSCLAEMITPEKTGLLFRNEEQLADHICDLMRRFSRGRGSLARMQDAIRSQPEQSWGDEWMEIVAPAIGLSRPNDKPQ